MVYFRQNINGGGKMPDIRFIGHIKNGYKGKFGIPRQSGLADKVLSEIVFEPEFNNPDAVRGIEGFSHLWLLWYFSENADAKWSPTVRPPRLGGNTRMGVFASRSPFRPNSIGLSCVKLEKVETRKGQGVVLTVSGADLMDGTPIVDIKPYLPFTDSREDAVGGFAEEHFSHRLNVSFPNECDEMLTEDEKTDLEEILSQDPRPSYQNDPERVYKMNFSDLLVEFKVDNDALSVIKITKVIL